MLYMLKTFPCSSYILNISSHRQFKRALVIICEDRATYLLLRRRAYIIRMK